nr:retrovirus-related Pol polyprotein from transposon TNT 1-94 [Tanacetum cinerariifolium]
MADMTAPSGQAPAVAPHVRTDEQIMPRIRWVQIGYLKFSTKGTKREVFGMPIPGSLITTDIREASYYQEYQANVAKHRRFLAGETGSAQDSPASKPAEPARKPKPTAQKARINVLQYLIHQRMSHNYALESIARILDMVPTKKVDKIPYELWHGKVPNLSYLKVWGCEAHVKRHTPGKLQQRSVKCIFIGYPKETMGYYFYYPPKNKIVVKRYADFLEKDFILQKESGRIIELEDEDVLPSENTSEHPIEEESLAPIVSQEEDVIPVRRSVRTHKDPDRLCLNVEIDPDQLCFNVKVEEHMLPPNAKVVKIKWIYKKKTDTDGKVHIYKAQLVAKGCTQTYGVDYEETFSPVADIRAIRILISITAYYNYEIWQMDVKTTFLNGFLEEEIYTEKPKGNHIPSLQEVKTYLGKCFSMKDLGEAAFILGIKIYRDRSRRLIGLSQNAYLDKILKRYRMDNSKRCSIPMQVDLHLSKSQCATTSAEMKRMQNVPYASAVGSIMYDVRKFIDELGVVPSNDYPIKMNCDNSAAVIMSNESGIQKGAKHFERKYHYVCDCIETGKIDIVKVHTDDNLADPFTKALAGPKLTRHARSMGLHPNSSFM